ncbi:MAG: tyrosine-type recombinase/integrase [Psychrobacillus sp.]
MNNILLASDYYKIWKTYTNLKPKSIKTYTVELSKFEKYLVHCGYKGELNFDKFFHFEESNIYAPIDKAFIDAYLDYLRYEKNASNHILYDNIVYLKNFFGLLKSVNKIKSNPIAHYKNNYYERKLIDRSLSLTECKKLLNASLTSDPFFRHDYTLLLLMMTTGLRNSEVRNLTLEQIDFDRGVIIVDKGQKNSPNTVYMTTSLKKELNRYLSHPMFEEWKKTGNRLLFFKDSEMLSSIILNKLIKSVTLSAGITKNVTAHTFRHTTAYLMQLANIDISIIQRQLRHASIATTIRYLPPIEKNNAAIDAYAESIELDNKLE